MKCIIKSMDFYGGNVLLYHDKRRTIKTHLGGFLTSIVVIMSTLIIISFGQDFLNKTNPSFIQQQYDPKNSYPNVKLSHDNFLLAFRIEDSDTKLVDPNGEMIYFRVLREEYMRLDNGQFNMTVSETLPYQRCIKEDFPQNLYSVFDNNDFQNMFCVNYNIIKKDVFIGGQWDWSFVNYFNIQYNICPENGINPNNKNSCKSFNETVKLLSKKLYVAFFLQDLYIDPSNYTTPITQTYKKFYQLLDKLLIKRTYFYFSNVIVNSNYGWLLDDIKTESGFRIQSIREDNNSMETLFGSKPATNFGASVFYLEKKQEKYTRNYVKLQTVGANVGGILKTITLLMAIFIQTYNRLSADFEILKEIQKFNFSSIIKYRPKNKGKINLNFQKSNMANQSNDQLNVINKRQPPEINNYTKVVEQKIEENIAQNEISKDELILKINTEIGKMKQEKQKFSPKNQLNSSTFSIIKGLLLPKKCHQKEYIELKNILKDKFSYKDIILNSMRLEIMINILFNEAQQKIMFDRYS